MKLIPLCELHLRYTSLEMVDFGSGGQIYGAMEGTVSGERLGGRLRLTNLAQRRSDGVNMPTLRGILETEDDAVIYVEMNGLANLRPADQARVFVTSFTLRTGDARYAWLSGTFCVVEGVLDRVTVGGIARGRAYSCEVTVGVASTDDEGRAP